MTDHQTSTLATRPVGRFEWEEEFRQAPVRPVSVKALGFVLATYATTRTGADIRPGVARLAADLGTSSRTIISGLGQLEVLGFLACVRRGSTYGRGGKGMASVYRLTLPVGAPDGERAEAEQVKQASSDLEQVKQASPDVDNEPAVPRDQVKADAGSGESQCGSGENPSRSGEARFTPPPHETPPHHSSPHGPLPGWTVTSPGPVDNSAEMNDESPSQTEEERRNEMLARLRQAHPDHFPATA